MSSSVLYYKSICNFQFQPCLENFNVHKLCKSFVKILESWHKLLIESGRLTIEDVKILDNKLYFVLECKNVSIEDEVHRKLTWCRSDMFKSGIVI